jgi:raffinose/stachyose/melibiose transport system substrate-binding protein
MKRLITLNLILVLIAISAAGCGNKTTGAAPNTSANPGATAGATNNAGGAKNVTIKLFQFKVEIAQQLASLIGEYEKANPGVHIQMDTVSGAADYGAALKAKFNSGDMPDIFNNGGYSDLNLWVDQLEDLSDQPWVKDLVKGAGEPMTKNGKLYGQPLNLEGYGFIYNKDLFTKAGITTLPRTLSEMNAAAVKLKASGITPFINGYGEWWILGNHFVNIPFAQQPDPNAFIAGLNNGTAKITGNAVFNNWVRLFDLTLKYGNKNPLQTDYKTEATDFALGKAAMTQQGSWTQADLAKTNPQIKAGFLPMPISDDPATNDRLPVGVPNNWVVHKNSPVKAEAKKFLNWMVSSDIGRRYITEQFKFIPAFTTIPADEKTLGPLAADIIRYSEAGKIISWNWFKFPGREASSKQFGDTMQSYVAGKITKAQMLTDFQTTWDTMKK